MARRLLLLAACALLVSACNRGGGSDGADEPHEDEVACSEALDSLETAITGAWNNTQGLHPETPAMPVVAPESIDVTGATPEQLGLLLGALYENEGVYRGRITVESDADIVRALDGFPNITASTRRSFEYTVAGETVEVDVVTLRNVDEEGSEYDACYIELIEEYGSGQVSLELYVAR